MIITNSPMFICRPQYVRNTIKKNWKIGKVFT